MEECLFSRWEYSEHLIEYFDICQEKKMEISSKHLKLMSSNMNKLNGFTWSLLVNVLNWVHYSEIVLKQFQNNFESKQKQVFMEWVMKHLVKITTCMTHRFAKIDINVKVSLSKCFDVARCLLCLLNILYFCMCIRNLLSSMQNEKKGNTMTEMCESLYLACGIDNFFFII